LVVKKKVVLLQSQNTRYGGEKRGEVAGMMIFETIGTKVADKYGEYLYLE
jgi:hypothetical protein